MKESHKHLVQQIAEMAEEGKLGESIKAARKEYERLPVGISTLLKCVVDAYQSNSNMDGEILQLRDLFCQLLVAIYRDAPLRNQEVAHALVHSLIKDYPGVQESCLAPQLCSLMEAALGFREVGDLRNRLMVWQQMSRIVLAYNEFLNALLGFLIPCLKCSKGKQPDPAVFATAYAAKVDQFNSLTGGENGPFYLITRLARPKLRNAIAHGTIWLDSNAAKVRYSVGQKKREEHEIELIEFSGLALSGSHLPASYLAAIGAIAVMEDGSDLAKAFLPQHLVQLFNFRKKET
jgi:hypothetical protein